MLVHLYDETLKFLLSTLRTELLPLNEYFMQNKPQIIT